LLLTPFYAIGVVLSKKQEVGEKLKQDLVGGGVCIGVAFLFASGYLNPTERASLMESSSLAFLLVVVV
jgi:hypothetical protein